jgi:hypothetical protein
MQECLDGGELPASAWGRSALKKPLKTEMEARLGELGYWEWRVPENVCLTDLIREQKHLAPAFGLAVPTNWEELVNLAVAIVEGMRRSEDTRKTLINLEQSGEKKERAEDRARSLKTIGVIVGVVGAAAGIAGIKAGADARAAASAQLQKETQKAEAEIAALDLQREASLPAPGGAQITGLSPAGKLVLAGAALVALFFALR